MQLKYLDAANFEEGDLQRKRGWAPRNRRIAVSAANAPGTHSWTCFCLTDLRNSRGFWLSRVHTGRNNSIDFVRFIFDCIICGAIQPGDYIAADNASIHRSGLSTRITSTLLSFVGARLLFLPSYAPELNPVECVWARVKKYMRNERGPLSFQTELLLGFLKVDNEMVRSFYRKCLFEYDRYT